MHALLALADTAGYQSGYGAGRRGVIADVVRRSARGIRGDLERGDPSMGRGDARSGSDGRGCSGHAVQMTHLLGEPLKAVRRPAFCRGIRWQAGFVVSSYYSAGAITQTPPPAGFG